MNTNSRIDSMDYQKVRYINIVTFKSLFRPLLLLLKSGYLIQTLFLKKYFKNIKRFFFT